MKTIILYFSFSGTTKKIANWMSEDLKADVTELREVGKRNRWNTYCTGAFKARRRVASDLLPINRNILQYENLILVTPIWAGALPPAIYGFIREYLLEGRKVFVVLCFSKDVQEAPSILADELGQYGIHACSILPIRTDRVTMQDLHKRRARFHLSETRGLVLGDERELTDISNAPNLFEALDKELTVQSRRIRGERLPDQSEETPSTEGKTT